MNDDDRPRGLWNIGPYVMGIIPIVLCGFFLSVLALPNIGENERHAATALKTLTSAEADFRANDRDGNGVNDFWTGDLAGLSRWGLIERGVAEADLRPIRPLVPKPIPYHGYYFVAMQRDESETPHEKLQIDTDKNSGKVHHPVKFGFCAFPEKFGVTGNWTYIVNENNTLRFERHNGHLTDYWPSDEELRHDWSIGALPLKFRDRGASELPFALRSR